MAECQSPQHPHDRIPEDMQRILWRSSGWGESHSGYDTTPFWACAKCRRRDLGRWKFYEKREVRRLRRKAVGAKEE